MSETSRTANIRWVAAAGAFCLLLLSGLVWYLLKPTKVTSIRDMRTLVERLDDLHRQIDSRRLAVSDAVAEFNAANPNDRITVGDVKAMELKDLQQQVLQRMAKAEKDVSYRGLLDEVGRLEVEISRLNNEIAAIEFRLPEPVEVKKGDTHQRLSMKYLTERKGLTPEEANAILGKIALVEEMVPGFRVWMMFDPGSKTFGSFVTQGTAPVSPRELQVRSRQAMLSRIETAKEAWKDAESRAKDLRSQKKELEVTVSDLKAHMAVAQWEREETQRRAEENEKALLALVRGRNSFSYAVGNLETFKRSGLVRRGRISTAEDGLFRDTVDMRSERTVGLSAGDAGLGRIGAVEVFPSNLKPGRDYEVSYTPDRQRATVTVLDKEAFLRERRVVFGLKH